MFLGLDLYHADPAQPLITAGQALDDLDHHLSEVWKDGTLNAINNAMG